MTRHRLQGHPNIEGLTGFEAAIAGSLYRVALALVLFVALFSRNIGSGHRKGK